mmetsp:Transcript_5143/g.21056  ORF Transcript_5143/g.21056 Transcript_5143/m.21056 type:complete len:283 (+) Transcript_5143:101-949(+)
MLALRESGSIRFIAPAPADTFSARADMLSSLGPTRRRLAHFANFHRLLLHACVPTAGAISVHERANTDRLFSVSESSFSSVTNASSLVSNLYAPSTTVISAPTTISASTRPSVDDLVCVGEAGPKACIESSDDFGDALPLVASPLMTRRRSILWERPLLALTSTACDSTMSLESLRGISLAPLSARRITLALAPAPIRSFRTSPPRSPRVARGATRISSSGIVSTEYDHLSAMCSSDSAGISHAPPTTARGSKPAGEGAMTGQYVCDSATLSFQPTGMEKAQ